MNNSDKWRKIYDNSNFGNQYPSSYLVSLFHTRLKPMLLKEKKDIRDVKVLDFACSVGANSMVFKNLGMQTYGIDVSERAIERIISSGERMDHFKTLNLIEPEKELKDVFPEVWFDLVIASEVLYYLKNSEIRVVLNKISKSMVNGGVLYASIPTYDTPMYKNYKGISKDGDGMIEVKESGSIKQSLYVNLPVRKDDLKEMLKPFAILDIMTVDTPLYSNEPFVEYHIIAEKS